MIKCKGEKTLSFPFGFLKPRWLTCSICWAEKSSTRKPY